MLRCLRMFPQWPQLLCVSSWPWTQQEGESWCTHKLINQTEGVSCRGMQDQQALANIVQW